MHEGPWTGGAHEYPGGVRFLCLGLWRDEVGFGVVLDQFTPNLRIIAAPAH